jgi:hypothetical protein
MKAYPSIPRTFRDFEAYVFDKLDGSNLRFEYSRKGGWVKFGTRTRLFDETDDVFGPAKSLFLNTIADSLANVLTGLRTERALVFAEYWSPNTIGGVQHKVPASEKTLTVFDLELYKKGRVHPADFRKILEDKVPTARFLGIHNWTRGFVERVRVGDLEGITFEGVVGKASGYRGNEIVMVKAKTQAWIDAIKERYGEQAKELIDS